MKNKIYHIYSVLYAFYGPQNWWPGDTPFEIMVGAVLTQNTNWNNVRSAIDNLKREDLLDLEKLTALPVEILAEKIRPAGYYNLKAKRLKSLFTQIERLGGSLENFFDADKESLRERLLEVKGVGPETADSIILYAAGKPSFVVDAYTHRILFRHHCIPEEVTYQEIQELFTSALPEDTVLFNEYHALLVRLGKDHCKKTSPRCTGCPLEGL